VCSSDLMRAGAIDGLSIGFKTIRSRTDPISKIRKIISADLWEISIVTFPMLADARIDNVKFRQTNSTDTMSRPSVREFEKWLMQDAGLTRREARVVIQKGYAQLASMQDAAFDLNSELASEFREAAIRLSARSTQ